MKFTLKDKALLRSWGHSEKDFAQIEEATRSSNTRYVVDGREVSREEAIRILGRKEYLSGIARSAFHYSAMRTDDRGNRAVLFDSSRLFQRLKEIEFWKRRMNNGKSHFVGKRKRRSPAAYPV